LGINSLDARQPPFKPPFTTQTHTRMERPCAELMIANPPFKPPFPNISQRIHGEFHRTFGLLSFSWLVRHIDGEQKRGGDAE